MGVTQKSKTDLRVTFLFYKDRKVRRVRVMGWGGYKQMNGYPAENKRDNRCFYGKRLLYL